MLGARLQLFLVIAVVIYFIVIISCLKRQKMNLKYSLLWLFSGLAMGILVIFPKLLLVLVRLVGIQTPMYGLLVFCIAFTLAILLSLTSIVSSQNKKIRKLIQESAMLEKRIRDLENR